jgi:hypothetical protein
MKPSSANADVNPNENTSNAVITAYDLCNSKCLPWRHLKFA